MFCFANQNSEMLHEGKNGKTDQYRFLVLLSHVFVLQPVSPCLFFLYELEKDHVNNQIYCHKLVIIIILWK